MITRHRTQARVVDTFHGSPAAQLQALEARRLLSHTPLDSGDHEEHGDHDGHEACLVEAFIANDVNVLDPVQYMLRPDGVPDSTATEFNIEFSFSASTPQTAQDAFATAGVIWESIIRGDIPDVFVSSLGRTVDDLLINASIQPIDGSGGILGSAGPTLIRSGSFLPITGSMRFDSADFTDFTTQSFLNVVLHEMGHVLGIGTIWSNKGLLSGSGTGDPRFTGTNATAEYQKLVRGRTVSSVEVEDDGGGGTANAHWNDINESGRQGFNNELMTGFLNGGSNPLSRITAASMIDLGYPNVNVDGADVYTVPTQTGLTGNDIPSIGTFSATPNPSSNVPVLLAVSSATDTDGIQRVGFWRESNGEPGLQTFYSAPGSFGVDTFIAFDTSSTGGWNFTIPANQVPAGTSTYYARAQDNLGAVSIVRTLTHTSSSDSTPPTVTGSSFDFQTRQAIIFNFSESVTGVDLSDLVLTNLTTGGVVPMSRFFFGPDSTSTSAVWQYDIATHGPLANGNYVASLPAGSVSDLNGNPLASTSNLAFFFLNGDANRDRTVDLADFGILRTNFGGLNKVFGQGDLNYDTNVDLGDFGILRANFGFQVPPPGNLFGGNGGDDGDDGDTVLL